MIERRRFRLGPCLFDTGEEEGIHYIVMGYVEGAGGKASTLRDLIDHKPLDVDHVTNLLQEALKQQRALMEERRQLRQSRDRIHDLETREAQLSERVHHLEEELAAVGAKGRERPDTTDRDAGG